MAGVIFCKEVDFVVKRQGNTMFFENTPCVAGYGSAVGKKESEGPLKGEFDKVIYDSYAGTESFEKAESVFVREAVSMALGKAKIKAEDIGLAFAGDLLNQCTASSLGLRDYKMPYIGVYSACSTMALSLLLSSVSVESGATSYALSAASSHFCSAERQYRFPLEYGSLRTPTSQWTVTGAGCCILKGKGNTNDDDIFIPCATVGVINDLGVTDQNNMGAAMAPAACDTLENFLRDTNTSPDDYDAIFTGDLGALGSELFRELIKKDIGYTLANHKDCGVLMYGDDKTVCCGGSGAGCCASVLCSHILPSMMSKRYKNVLFMATGALLSPTSVSQGESIHSIAHLINFRCK